MTGRRRLSWPKGRPGRYVVAIDLGGSRVRALVFDLRGRVRGQGVAGWAPRQADGLAPLGKEIEPQTMWRLVGRLVKAALRDAGARPREVLAVAATSQRQGAVFLDAAGGELYACPNSDARAFFEGQRIDADFGDEVYRTTGHRPSLLLAPAKLRWLEAHRPGLFERVRMVVSLDGWLSHKLGGEAAQERAAGVEIGLVDLCSGEAPKGLLRRLGVLPEVVPPLVSAGEVVGAVTKAAARVTGLAERTPVVAAGPDTQCALLGMGVTRAGSAGVVAGSTAPVQMALDRPVVDAKGRTWSGRHVLGGLWVLESNAAEASPAWAWLVSVLKDGSGSRAIDRLALRAPAGSNGALAYLGPRRCDMREPGLAWGGLLFPTPLSFGHVGRAELFRAALENLAFAARANIEQVEECAGQRLAAISLGGGMARSPALRRILADVLGTPVATSRCPEASALGAAMASAAGAGAYRDLEEAARAMAQPGKPAEPDPAAALEYREHYRRWFEVGMGLKRLGRFL